MGAWASSRPDAPDSPVEAALATPSQPAVSRPVPASPVAASPAPRVRRSVGFYGEPILSRSIFDPSQVGGPDQPDPADGAVETDLDLVLVSTMVVEPAAYSSAWIGREETKKVRKTVKRKRRRKRRRRRKRLVRVRSVEDGAGYGIGDQIQGHDAVVVAIAQGQVTLRRADGREQLLRVDPPDDTSEPAAPVRAPARDDGIEKLGTDHVAVDRRRG